VTLAFTRKLNTSQIEDLALPQDMYLDHFGISSAGTPALRGNNDNARITPDEY